MFRTITDRIIDLIMGLSSRLIVAQLILYVALCYYCEYTGIYSVISCQFLTHIIRRIAESYAVIICAVLLARMMRKSSRGKRLELPVLMILVLFIIFTEKLPIDAGNPDFQDMGLILVSSINEVSSFAAIRIILLIGTGYILISNYEKLLERYYQRKYGIDRAFRLSLSQKCGSAEFNEGILSLFRIDPNHPGKGILPADKELIEVADEFNKHVLPFGHRMEPIKCITDRKKCAKLPSYI